MNKFFSWTKRDLDGVKEYLEEMALKGYMLERIVGPILTFKEIEPKKIQYSVDVLNTISEFDSPDSEESLDYREFCEKCGWNFVCEYGKIQVYSSEDMNVVPIHTDEEIRFNEISKSFFKSEIAMNIYFIVMGILLCVMQGSSYLKFLNDIAIICILLWIVVIASNIFNLVDKLIWHSKNRKRVSNGEKIKFCSLRDMKIRSMVPVFILILAEATLFAYGIVTLSKIGLSMIFALILIDIVFLILFLVEKVRVKHKLSSKVTMCISICLIMLFAQGIIISLAVGNIISYKINGEDKTNINTISMEDFGYVTNEEYESEEITDSILGGLYTYYYEPENDDEPCINYEITESNRSYIISYRENYYGKIYNVTELTQFENEEIKKCFIGDDNTALIVVTDTKLLKLRSNFEINEQDISLIIEKAF